LIGVARRYKEYDFEEPLLYSTDDCCHEKSMLEEVFSTLRDQRIDVGIETSNLDELTLPSYNRQSVYLRSTQQIRHAIGELQELVNEKKLKFVGLDAEWVPGSPGVHTLQIATADGRAFLIPIHQLKTIPAQLKFFLEDDEVAKVGRQIGGDVSRLRHHHGIVVQNTVEIGTRA